MTEPTLDLQKAVRLALVASSDVTALVPASVILDRNLRPEVFPCILIGEGHAMPSDGLARVRHRAFLDLHVWTNEDDLASCKRIVGAIRDALKNVGPLDNFATADLRVTFVRFLREHDEDKAHGAHGHGVVTIEAELVELTT